MSRIGKVPVTVPGGVEVTIGKTKIDVKGPKGKISTDIHPKISYERDGDKISVVRVDDSRIARMQHGLRRTLLANCVHGVTQGFEKAIEVVGVGYKVSLKGKSLNMALGFSHPVDFPLPEGVDAKVEGPKVTLSGVDKQLVGETAARIRRIRPPEPFKGKGIKYADETVRRKAGKSGKK